MVFLAGLLRASQIVWTDTNYTLYIAHKKTLFSGRPNPFRVVPRSILYLSLLDRNNRQYYLNRLGLPWRLFVRLISISLLFWPSLFIGVPLYILGYHGALYYFVLHGLRLSGATFIKLGQWAATRPDILPIEFCKILAQLHSRAPAHGMSWNKFIFKSEFGKELNEIFEEFDPIPVGSGTIAQVHKAKLKGEASDQMVAIKICHPHIQEKVTIDLQLMTVFSQIFDQIPNFRWLNLTEEIGYFCYLMEQQLDLRHEAYTLDKFSRNFSTWKTVHVPIPIYPFVSSMILTESFARGVSVGKYSAYEPKSNFEEWHNIKRQIATIGLQSFLQMLLWDNFVHADLHPGNILVRFVDRNGNVKWSDPPNENLPNFLSSHSNLYPQLVFLDTGLVTTLSRKDFQNFNDLFVSLVLKADGRRVGRLVIERSPPLGRHEVIDEEIFCHSMDEIIRPVFSSSLMPIQLSRFSIGPVLARVFELVRRHHVRLDGSFTNLVMSFICVEGLGRQLAPDLNLIPFLARAALQYLVTNVAMNI